MIKIKKYISLLFIFVLFSCIGTKNKDNTKYIILNMNIDDFGKTSINPIGTNPLGYADCAKKIEKITKTNIKDWEPNDNPLGNFSAIILKQNGIEISTLICFPYDDWKNTDGIISKEIIEIADIKEKNAKQINSKFKNQDELLKKMKECGIDKFDYYNIPIMYSSPFICDDYTDNRKVPTKTIFEILENDDKENEYILVKNIISNNGNNILTFPDSKKIADNKVFSYSYTRKGCINALNKEMKNCINAKNKALSKNICKVKEDNYVLYSCINNNLILKNVKDVFSFSAGQNNLRNVYLDSEKLYNNYPTQFPKRINESRIKDYTIFPLE